MVGGGGVMDPKSNIAPPRRRNEDEEKEERKSEMGVQKNWVSVNPRTRTYYHRRCKSRKMMNIESLPNDMVFNILLQLPVQDIYEVTRFVCCKWYHMIRTHHFVYEHLKRSTATDSSGLLIQPGLMAPLPFGSMRLQGREPLIYVSMRQQGHDRSIETSIFSCEFGSRVWTSCNGLLLLVDFDILLNTRLNNCMGYYYMDNPATKRRFYLPRLICPVLSQYRHSGLAYVAASMEYKVVVTYRHEEEEEEEDEGGNNNDKMKRFDEQDCAILTVGVDKSWRHVNTDYLSRTARKLLNSIPLVTEGFLHWYDCDKSGLVVTLNIETEILREFHVPQGYEKREKEYLSTGKSYLSFVSKSSELLSWEAWEMKPDTGEWTKLPNIDLEAKKQHDYLLSTTEHGCVAPIGWLKYNEVMVFYMGKHPFKHFIAYDAHTQKIHPFELDSGMCYSIAHVSSLVCLDG